MGRPDYKAMVAAAKVNPSSALYAKARAAGMAAAAARVPTPMVVVRHANPLDDNSPVVKRYEPVMDGVCGFAWIKCRPARGPFFAYCKAEGLGRKDYDGGWSIWVSDFNQSMERKEAYAYAFAEVLNESPEAGVTAYGQSRMD